MSMDMQNTCQRTIGLAEEAQPKVETTGIKRFNHLTKSASDDVKTALEMAGVGVGDPGDILALQAYYLTFLDDVEDILALQQAYYYLL